MKHKKKFIILTYFLLFTLISFAQTDTIRVAKNKTIHIAFPTAVKYCDLGSGAVIAASTTDQTANILRLKAQEPFSYATNLSVITASEQFYSFALIYDELASTYMYDYRPSLPATSSSNAPVIASKKPKLLEKINKFKARIYHIGTNANKLLLSCDGIYIHRDTLYFSLSLENNSPLGYMSSSIKLQVEDIGTAERSATQITPVHILEQIGSLTTPSKGKSKLTISASQFTLQDKQQLVIYLYEEKGSRNMQICIYQEDISNALML